MKKYLFIILLVGVCFGQEDSQVLSSYVTYEYWTGCDVCPNENPRYRNFVSYNSNGKMESNTVQTLWYFDSLEWVEERNRTLFNYDGNELIDSTNQRWDGYWKNKDKWEKVYLDNYLYEFDFNYNSELSRWDTVSLKRSLLIDDNKMDYTILYSYPEQIVRKKNDSIKYYYENQLTKKITRYKYESYDQYFF